MTVEPIHSTQQCLLCAAPLERGARKCLKCSAFQDGHECISCGATIPASAVRCQACKKVQRGTPCVVCGALLETGSKRCSECNSWQTMRRYIPEGQITLALLLSLISVCSAVIPPLYNHFTNHSATYVRVIGAEPFLAPGKTETTPTIVVFVANTGKRPSMVKSAVLRFTKSGSNAVDLEEASLDALDFRDVLVMPDAPIRLHFAGSQIDRRSGKSYKQVEQQVLAGGTATLIVTIEETDRNGETFDARAPHTFKAIKIKPWLDENVLSQ